MNLIGLDFETFHDVGYALGPSSKLSTSEFITDPRFEQFGMGIKHGAAPAIYVEPEDVASVLDDIDWERTVLYAHNMPFDGYILHYHFHKHPKMYLCTMAMAEAVLQHSCRNDLNSVLKFLGKPIRKTFDIKQVKGQHWKDIDEATKDEIRTYGANDIEMAYLALQELRPSMTLNEIFVLSETLRMFCDPVLELDLPLLEEELEEAKQARIQLLARVPLTEEELRARNAVAFEQQLNEYGVPLPQKWSEKQECFIPALAKGDKGMQELLTHEDERVRDLAAAKQAVSTTIDITRAERMIQMATTGDRKFAPLYHYCRAHTKRWSGGNKRNAQNFKRGGRIRRAIRAPEGYLLCAADLSQIEARVTALVADEKDLLEVFRDPTRDPYNEMAEAIYQCPVDRKNGDPEHEEMGFIGKTVVLGCGFQMGAPKFRAQLAAGIGGRVMRITQQFAEAIIQTYRHKNWKTKVTWDTLQEACRVMAFGTNLWQIPGLGVKIIVDPINKRLILPDGNYLLYPGFRVRNGDYEYYEQKGGARVWKKMYGGKMLENIVQCLARGIVAEALGHLARNHSDLLRIVMTTHDELVALFLAEHREQVEKLLSETLRRPPDWGPTLPIDLEYSTEIFYAK